MNRVKGSNKSLLRADETAGLGEIQILHPPGVFALTPASHIAVRAIATHQQLLHGNGLDWGSGTGCLAIVAAKIKQVEKVIGLEISALDIDVARQNAVLNGVENKTAFFLSDSYHPSAEADRRSLETMRGQISFILANPPSSDGDDGFEYRRRVLRGARKYLMPGGVVFLNISYQYGEQRVQDLMQQIPGFSYGGVLVGTDWVPFDLQRDDLHRCLVFYATEERRGGLTYSFANPEMPKMTMDAQTALSVFQQKGLSPLTRWQTHLWVFGNSGGVEASAGTVVRDPA
ncbi:MAG: class I SAM-dependent methyltransferase [Anaerolineales bacterium]|nr:class I SAM-dependent methyltransferase [Anaerolineales bacterium]